MDSVKDSDGRERALSIQSHVVSGYVGNKCAVFPLQVLGFEVDFINSVQFSNHTGYETVKGQVLEATDLEELFKGLLANDLVHHTHMLTGYVGAGSFLHKIKEVVQQVKAKNPKLIYLCDPVLGDNGSFYVPESLIPIYQKELLPLATIATPNHFELEKLSGQSVTCEGEALDAMTILHSFGVSIVVLTSLDSGGEDIITYASQIQGNHPVRTVWKYVGKRLDNGLSFVGSGDLYSALFLAWFSRTNGSLPKTLELVGGTMEKVLMRTANKCLRQKDKEGSSAAKTELEVVKSLGDIQNPLPNVNREAVLLQIQ